MQKDFTEKLRICHLIGSLRHGGAERQLINLMNHLDVSTKSVILLSGEQNTGFYRLLDKNINTYFVPTRIRYFFYAIIKIVLLLKQNQISVVQTHMFWANFFGTIAGKLAGVPVILTTEHGRNPWKKKLHYWIERKIITKFADLRICVSKDILLVRKNNDKIPENKLKYIPNAISIPTNINKNENKKITIGAIGRFIKAKDYSTLIKAASILRENNIDFDMFILGDGPLKKELKTLRSQLGLDPFIKMPGFQDNIDEWMCRFDLFVISSISEGQPLVLLEAMSYRLATVSTNIGGIPDTVKDGEEAILVEPGNPVLLASAMRTLINNKGLREKYGQKARERAEKEFSIEAICNQYKQLYLSILKFKNK